MFTLGLPPAAAAIIPAPQKPAPDSAFYLKILQYIVLRKESITSPIKMIRCLGRHFADIPPPPPSGEDVLLEEGVCALVFLSGTVWTTSC